MAKTDDRNAGAIVSVVLLSAFVAAMAVCAALSFVWRHWSMGALCVAAFCVVLWLLAGLTKLWKKKDAFDRNFRARKFDEAEKYAREIAESKLFYPIMRFTGFCVMLAISMAKDDLQEAEKYIFRIRHGGGAGWKYRTAYYYTLILMDKGDVSAARAEYEDFRIHNQNVELYRSQLEVLDAMFRKLFTRNDMPLPASVTDSFFPVVHRILGKHFEAQVAASGIEWN